MQVDLYLASERGMTTTPWLVSKNTFTFANYYHPKRMNFGTLRVLNDDVVSPGGGFSLHSHDNMEIITIVLEGELEHRDTLENHGRLQKGDVQRMSAGTGIRHSEMNASSTDKVHFLQLWILPSKQDLPPSYEQKRFGDEQILNKLCRIASGKKSSNALFLHQDASLFMGKWNKESSFTHMLSAPNYGLLVFVIEGKARIGGFHLKTGDSAAITDADAVEITSQLGTQLLLIEVRLN